jgi:hypothetical protein
VRIGRPRSVPETTIRRTRAARTRGVLYAAIASRLNADSVPTAHGSRKWHVKGWGEPLLTAKGMFTYPQDIRASQYNAAQRSEEYRLEIVANLDAHRRDGAAYQRLSLTAQQICDRAIHRLYDIPLAGLEDNVWSGGAPAPVLAGVGSGVDHYISNERLQPNDLCPAHAGEYAYHEFALTFSGYQAFGSTGACANGALRIEPKPGRQRGRGRYRASPLSSFTSSL